MGAGCGRRPCDDKAEAALQVLGWKAWGGHQPAPSSQQEWQEAVVQEGAALPQRGLSPVVEISDFRPPEP